MDDWISVNDNLPESGGKFLIDGLYGIEIAFYNPRDGWVLPNQLNAPTPWIIRSGVTHWAPLPPRANQA